MFTFIRRRGVEINPVTFSQILLPLSGGGILLMCGVVTAQNTAVHIVLYYYLLATISITIVGSLARLVQKLQKKYQEVTVGEFTGRWAGWVVRLPLGTLGGIVFFFWV